MFLGDTFRVRVRLGLGLGVSCVLVYLMMIRCTQGPWGAPCALAYRAHAPQAAQPVTFCKRIHCSAHARCKTRSIDLMFCACLTISHPCLPYTLWELPTLREILRSLPLEKRKHNLTLSTFLWPQLLKKGNCQISQKKMVLYGTQCVLHAWLRSSATPLRTWMPGPHPTNQRGSWFTHLGVHKTHKSLHRLLYWSKMFHTVHEYVRTCMQCLRNKSKNQRPMGLLQPLPLPDHCSAVMFFQPWLVCWYKRTCSRKAAKLWTHWSQLLCCGPQRETLGVLDTLFWWLPTRAQQQNSHL